MSDNNEEAGAHKQHPEEPIDLMGVLPSSFGSAMFMLEACNGIRPLFRHNTLAVLSVFREDRSTDENFAEQARLCRLLLKRGLAYIPVAGEWPGVGKRGLLLREILQEQTRATAAEFGLGTYLWSVRGRWAIYETSPNRALAVGEALSIGGPEVGWLKAVCHPDSGVSPSTKTTFRILKVDEGFRRFWETQKRHQGEEGGNEMSSDLSGITFEDHGGDSPEKSIVIHGAPNNAVGIHAEYEFLASRLGLRNRDWRPTRQSTGQTNGRRWDMIVARLADGTEKTVYFDITEFFGKW